MEVSKNVLRKKFEKLSWRKLARYFTSNWEGFRSCNKLKKYILKFQPLEMARYEYQEKPIFNSLS